MDTGYTDRFQSDHAEKTNTVARQCHEVICWRELAAPQSGADTLPWTPQCRTRTSGAWEDISPPLDEVSCVWEPAVLVDDDGTVWLASIDHPTEIDTVPATGVWLQSWTPDDGWSAQQNSPGDLNYPTHIVAVPGGSGDWLVAFAAADTAAGSRNSRNVRVYRVSLGQPWTELARTRTPSGSIGGLSTGYDRHERPAVRTDGDRISVALTGYTEQPEGVFLGLLESRDGGQSWSHTELNKTGQIFPHVRPVWGGDGSLYWARQVGGEATVCRRAPSDTVTCTETGAPYVEGLTPAAVSAHSGDQQWVQQPLRWD